jgi:transcription antitermination factor NusA-like protein
MAEDRPLPICASCADSKFLCKDCEKLYSDSRISVYDVEVSRILRRLLGDEASFIHAVETAEHIVVIADPDQVGSIIGKGGHNLNAISETLGRPVKVVGKDSFNDMVAALVAPARVRGINPVLAPGGAKKIRVKIEGQDRGRLRMSVSDMQKLVCAVTDEQVELAFT